MESNQFNILLEKLYETEKDILINKGQEYRRGDSDVLANFKRLAKMLDLPVEKVWAVYFTKHFDAIINFVKTGKIFSEEKIDERIIDARNYLALGLALFQEGADGPKKILENPYLNEDLKAILINNMPIVQEKCASTEDEITLNFQSLDRQVGID